MNKLTALFCLLLVCSGCTVGPEYKKPVVSVPGTYRGLSPEQSEKNDSTSIGDQKWSEVFQDEQLRLLIGTALQQNFDLRIAASRILEAQARLGITRADQYLSVRAGAAITDNRQARSEFLPAFEGSTGQLRIAAVWELG